MKTIATTLLFFITTKFAWSQNPELIKDINPATFQDGVTYYLEQPLAEFNGKVYFAANDGSTGTELWVTDGTEGGTNLVKDLNEGMDGSSCQKFYPSVNYLFFVATDELHGKELWRTDGTEGGTILIKDINPGSGDGVFHETSELNDHFFAWNDIFYFTADDGQSGIELWRTDGTEDGTYMVKDINDSGSSTPRYFALHNDLLYFNSMGNIWRTDGTEDGTEIVKSGVSMSRNVVCNDYLLFVGRAAGGPPFDKEHLWRTDGTEAGTIKIKEINPSDNSFVCTFFDEIRFKCINDVAYFVATDGNGRELWRSDGTESGTFMVKDAAALNSGTCAANMAVLNDVLYYAYNDGEHGYELWRTDGSEAGTYMLKDMINGATGSMGWVAQEHIGVAGDKLFFAAGYDFPLDLRLWMSDGTENGTALVTTNSAFSESEPQHFTVLGDYVIFTADAENKGFELWRLPLMSTSIKLEEPPFLQIEIAPTLTKNEFRILPLDVDASRSLFDIKLLSLTGSVVKVWEGVRPNEVSSISGIRNGLYIAQISTSEGVVSKKIIVSN